MKLTISVIIFAVFSGFIYPQIKCGDEKPIYTFSFLKTNHQLILCGYPDSSTNNFLYASEFYVINSSRKDTVLFFDALQNCRINKTEKNSLAITQYEKLPFGKNFEWIDCDYLKYVLTDPAEGRIKVDTTFVLYTPSADENTRSAIYRQYNQVLKKKSEVSEELPFQVLLLALNNDEKARDILFKMSDELNLDGVDAEMSTKALNIYKNYLYFQKGPYETH